MQVHVYVLCHNINIFRCVFEPRKNNIDINTSSENIGINHKHVFKNNH